MQRFVALVFLALLLAACGGGDGATDNAPAIAGQLPPSTTTTAASDVAGAAPPPAGSPTTKPSPRGPATGGDLAPAPPPSPTTDATAPPAEPAPGSGALVLTPTDDGSQGPPGAFARTLLRPRPAVTIVFEQLHQRGAEPASASVAFAVDSLKRVTAKGVDVPEVIVLGGAARSWSADDLRTTADTSGRATQGGGRAVLRVLFVRGTFEGSDSVLGVAVRGDVLAVFSDSVAAARTPVVTGDAIEEAVLVHELGHVLGLVDLARNTGRADKEHPGHSSNTRSVLYWAVESSLIGQVLTGPPPRQFDADDIADLNALKNGA